MDHDDDLLLDVLPWASSSRMRFENEKRRRHDVHGAMGTNKVCNAQSARGFKGHGLAQAGGA
jgi:hypothetical protein